MLSLATTKEDLYRDNLFNLLSFHWNVFDCYTSYKQDPYIYMFRYPLTNENIYWLCYLLTKENIDMGFVIFWIAYIGFAFLWWRTLELCRVSFDNTHNPLNWMENVLLSLKWISLAFLTFWEKGIFIPRELPHLSQKLGYPLRKENLVEIDWIDVCYPLAKENIMDWLYWYALDLLLSFGDLYRDNLLLFYHFLEMALMRLFYKWRYLHLDEVKIN